MKSSDVRLKSRLRASNLKAYNGKLLHRYDTSSWVKFWIGQWDNEVLLELGDELPLLNILDVGCATGRLLCCLADSGACNLAGTDIAPNIVGLAAANLSKRGVTADLRVSDAEDKLPWDSSLFDAVTLTGVLHHFFVPSKAIFEIFRVLKSGGRLVAIEPLFFTPLRNAVNFYLRFFSHEGDCRFYSQIQAEELFGKCGFANIRSRKVTFHSFILTAEKS